MGGAALLSGLYFTWQTLQVNREGQITERFTHAIDQLGASGDNKGEKLEIRLGGIYALERIARDSETHHWPVTAVLAAYVLQHAPRKDKEHLSKEDYPPLSRRLPEVQTILSVLGRRLLYYEKGEDIRISLRNTDLGGAYIEARAHFEGVYFDSANLECANLVQAYLEGASFQKANLRDANFEGASFKGADLQGAKLQRANFSGADLVEVKGLTQEQLEQAFGDATIKLPAGLEMPKSWTKGEDE